MTTLSIILLIVIAAQIFLIVRLVVKVNNYEKFINELYVTFTDAYERFEALDTLGAFQADDEVGTIFANMKKVIILIEEKFTRYRQ